jgi:hypothetical protein
MSDAHDLIYDPIDPKWDETGRVHDWRNYITEKLIALWPTFTDEQKIAIAEMAELQANSENWE